MSEYVSKRLRSIIASRANGQCEYCCTPAKFSIDPFVAEHIHPRSKGGLSTAENLAFACMGCNGFKQDKIEGHDVVSKTSVLLYHPRTQTWNEHFAWNEAFTHLVGLTPVGRVTIIELQLNREGVTNVRQLLLLAGLHPPSE